MSGRGCGFARAPKDRADSRHQLARIERLGKIVVGADLQAEDAIDSFATRGQQKYGDGRLLAQSLQKFEPRPAGQHHVENDEFVIVRHGCA